MGRKMQVKTTATLLKEINKRVKSSGGDYCIEKIIREKYKPGGWDDDSDFCTHTGYYYQYIVLYKPDMYAIPREIRTHNLVDYGERCSKKTLDSLCEEIIESVKI